MNMCSVLRVWFFGIYMYTITFSSIYIYRRVAHLIALEFVHGRSPPSFRRYLGAGGSCGGTLTQGSYGETFVARIRKPMRFLLCVS